MSRKKEDHAPETERLCSEEDQNAINAAELLPVPPDGGWGWVIVFASFMANMVVDGIAYSFGILFPEFHAYFRKSKQETAWVGSLLTGVYMLIGPFVSGLVNKFGARAVMIAGSLIASVGFIISVFVPSLPLLMLFYGICGGVGFGFIYLPACVYVGYYFEKKRALATGIAVAGSGLGTFVFAPLATALLSEFQWQGTLLILAGIIANCAVFGALMRPLEHPKAVKRLQTNDPNIAEKINISSPLLRSEKDVELKTMQKSPEPFSPEQQPQRRFHSSLSESYAKDADVHERLLTAVQEATTDQVTPRRLEDELKDALVQSVRNKGHEFIVTPLKEHDQRMSKLTSKYVASMGSIPSSFQKRGVASPFARQDAFYSGSLLALTEMKKTKDDMTAYRQSIVSLPHLMESIGIGTDDFEPSAATIADTSATGGCLPPKVRSVLLQMMDYRLFRHPSMTLLCVSNLFGMLGFYIPFVYLTDYAVMIGCTLAQGSLLLSMIGVTNTLGRVAFGWATDHIAIKALTINNFCLVFCGIITMLFPFLNSYALLMTYSLVFGFFIAPYISLTAIILVDELGLENLTNGFGIVILARGASAMIGSPLGGAVFDATGSYSATFYFAGALIILAGLVSFMIPVYHRFCSSKHRPVPVKPVV